MPCAPLTLAALHSRCAAGETFEYLYFWGHRPKRPAQVDRSCLSQWLPAPFVLDGIAYPSAEHYMMAQKARLFGDAATLARILAARGPGQAKDLGRQVAGYVEADWARERFAIVVRGNVAKFGQHPAPGAFLRATGDTVLVEASPDDAIWGIGMTEFEDAARRPADWRGLNLLGFALMAARAALFG